VSEDLVSKFDALNARFRAEYDLYRALNLECVRLYEEFKRCRFWQFRKQAEIAATMHERWAQSAERIAKMTEIHEELSRTRREMEALLLAVKRDMRNMQ
jgi:hypothetical protein